MSRLHTELARLYFVRPAGEQATAAPGARELVGPDGRVRALVLELARPATWAQLARAWQGVQTDLEMPAPAIAVSGHDSHQLWFSLAQPIDADTAFGFLHALRHRYLGDVAPERVRIQPSRASTGSSRLQHAGALPPMQLAPDRWSAFVAPDLAALFTEEPWLDLPPGDEAQADLLSRIASTPPEIFLRASARLDVVATPGTAVALAGPSEVDRIDGGEPVPDVAFATPALDPRGFLLAVMRNPAVDLQLRVEAAKALLLVDRDAAAGG